MKAQIRHDDVERRVGKRHLLLGRADERTPSADILDLEIAAGGRFGVAAHILAGPDIDTDAASRAADPIQSPRRSGKQQATSASDIEYLLVTAPRVERKHEVSMAKLSELHIDKVGETFEDQDQPGPEEHRPWEKIDGTNMPTARPENSEQEAGNTKQKQVAQNVWRIDALIRLLVRRMARQTVGAVSSVDGRM